jgi:formiminotetrahydrofolate cyclodeaminase
MYLYGTIRSYAEAASSGQPTPGGGSVAALAGALGMTMSCMAANFTVGKKKFKAVEPEVRQRLADCLRARDELLRLMDEDTQAYAAVSAAYAMPKETPALAAARTEMIQKALVAAMDAPLQVVRTCRSALEPIARLAEIANPNLISDVGVAAILAEAALRAAKLNVEINLQSLEDPALSSATRNEIVRAAEEARAITRKTMEKVVRAIGGTL